MNEHRGRKPKYVTLEKFDKFINNEFWHLRVKVQAIFWLVLTILAAIIASWAIG